MHRAFLSIFIVGIFVTVGIVHAATPAQCAALEKVAGDVPCNKDTPIRKIEEVLGITNNVGAAKQYLQSIARDRRNSCAPPSDPRNIQRLNNTFSVCAANFLRAYEATYGKGSVVVVSAFRDGASGSAPDGSRRSANACAGGVPGSNHTRGVAMDVNPGPGGSYDTLHNFARRNPQFGVCFPLPTYRGKPDLPHMILAGIGGSESARCAAQGITRPCSGAPTYIPDSGLQSGDPPSVADRLRDFISGGDNNKSLVGRALEKLKSGFGDGQEAPNGNSARAPSGPPARVGQVPSKVVQDSFGGNGSVPSAQNENTNISENKNTNRIDITNTSGTISLGARPTSTGVTTTPATQIETIARGNTNDDNEDARTTSVITVPPFQAHDVASVFDDRDDVIVRDITYISDDTVSLEVQLRKPDGSSGVAGFFGESGTFEEGESGEGLVGRICTNRPWYQSELATQLLARVFDNACNRLGYPIMYYE